MKRDTEVEQRGGAYEHGKPDDVQDFNNRVKPQPLAHSIAYFNVLNGIALFLGSSLGGFLASRLPLLFGYQLLGLFALSCFCRVAFYLLLSRSFREVRPAHEVSIHAARKRAGGPY